MLPNKDQYPEMPAKMKLINLATIDDRPKRSPDPRANERRLYVGGTGGSHEKTEGQGSDRKAKNDGR